jgi:hypothetical protein
LIAGNNANTVVLPALSVTVIRGVIRMGMIVRHVVSLSEKSAMGTVSKTALSIQRLRELLVPPRLVTVKQNAKEKFNG